MSNAHVIVGPPRGVILYKPPPGRVLQGVDIIGAYKDGYQIATCSQKKIARLRKEGAEVILVHADANAYAAMVDDTEDPSEIERFIDERVERARADMAVADSGRSSGEEPA